METERNVTGPVHIYILEHQSTRTPAHVSTLQPHYIRIPHLSCSRSETAVLLPRG